MNEIFFYLKNNILIFIHILIGIYGFIIFLLSIFKKKIVFDKEYFSFLILSLTIYTFLLPISICLVDYFKLFFIFDCITLLLICFFAIKTYNYSKKKRYAYFPFFLSFIIISLTVFLLFQTKLNYFNTLSPVVFIFLLLTIYSSKYHKWSLLELIRLLTLNIFICAVLFYAIFISLSIHATLNIIIQINISLLISLLSSSVFLVFFFIQDKILPTLSNKKRIHKLLHIETYKDVNYNPFSSDINLLTLLTQKFKTFSDIKIIYIGLLCEDQLSISKTNPENRILIDTINISSQIKTFFYSITAPVSKLMTCIELSSHLTHDFFKIINFDSLDSIIAVKSCFNNNRLLLFVKHEDLAQFKSIDTEMLYDLEHFFQFFIYSYEMLRTEKTIQALLKDANEKRMSYEMMVQKVDDVNDALTSLQEKQKQIIESERWISLSQITVTLNHEINNPLTLIFGMGQLLQTKLSKGLTISEEDFKKHLTSIAEQGQRIVEIIKSLRKISVPVIEKYLPEIDMIKLDIHKGKE